VLIVASRGKKFLRRFEDDGDDDNLSDLEIQRRAGLSPSRRLTRSTLKPRILFPTAEQVRAREAAAEEADEEAVTDIEVPCPAAKTDASGPSPKPGASRKRAAAGPADFRTPSPPPAADATTDAAPSVGAEVPTKPTNKYLQKPKSGRSTSPFDSWTRIKPVESVSDTKGATATAKRRGSPMERSAKRVKSDGHRPL
jgi:hypothetical protein